MKYPSFSNLVQIMQLFLYFGFSSNIIPLQSDKVDKHICSLHVLFSEATRMILSSCISWIHVLYQKLVNPFNPMTESEHLPEDIIAEILIRLPAEHVHQCRAICKEWNSLISTSLFNEMYLKHATPTLVFQQCTRHQKELFFTDEWGDMNNSLGKPTKQKICTSNVSSIKYNETPYLSFSCNGLIVFRKSLCAPNYSIFLRNSFTTIFNPITRQEITLHHRHKDNLRTILSPDRKRVSCAMASISKRMCRV